MGKAQIDSMLQQARVAFNANDMARTRAICQDVLQRDRRNVTAMTVLGRIALEEGAYEDAAAMLLEASRQAPGDPRPLAILGEVRTFQGRYDEAVADFDKALAVSPDDPQTIALKAGAYEKSGQRDKARKLLRPFIESRRETPDMAVIQGQLELHDRHHDAIIELVGRQLKKTSLRGMTRRTLGSILGLALERSGRYDEAFAAYRDANETLPAPFNADAWTRYTSELIEAYTAGRLPTLPRATHGSELPVFIVGIPRCGSTLVETILDAHPDVRGAGELIAMPRIAREMSLLIGSSLPYPATIQDLDDHDVATLAASYLQQLQAGNGSPRRIVDKYLENYRNLGLIELLAPRARVIHCRRHPLDTCLSCYAQNLPASAHPYISDLRNLGLVYADYDRLMKHWHDVLSLPILDVQYETLVADQEGTTRQIIDFCGLDWDDRCLRYYEGGRVVQTASYDQVTRPIYSSSVGRYKHFREQLAPLEQALIEGGLAPEDLD